MELMLSFGANVIIWCYHVMLSSGMIIPPFFIFPENFTHSIYTVTDWRMNKCIVLPMLENQKLFYFYSQQCQFTLVYLSHQRQRGHHFQYFEQYFEIFWKKYNLALYLVEMDTDPDPPKLLRMRGQNSLWKNLLYITLMARVIQIL